MEDVRRVERLRQSESAEEERARTGMTEEQRTKAAKNKKPQPPPGAMPGQGGKKDGSGPSGNGGGIDS